MRGFLFLLLVLVVAFVALGFYQGWFRFGGDRDNAGSDKETKVLTVNKDKMKEDLERMKDKAKELGSKIKDEAAKVVDKVKEKVAPKSAGEHTATGTVKRVEPADNRLVLTTADDKDLVLHLTADVWTKLGDLKAGDKVTVTYREQDGKNEATAVTVEKKG